MKARWPWFTALLAAGATAAAAQAPRTLALGREERAPLAALARATAGPDRAAQDSALAGARAGVTTPAGRYALGYYQYQLGRSRGDIALQGLGVDAMIESGQAAPDELPGLFAFQSGRALAGRDASRTDRALARMVEAQPNDPIALVDYGQFTAGQLGSARPAAASAIRARAIALFRRALAANDAAGRISPESWHLRAFALAYDGTRPAPGGADMSFAPAALALGKGLVAAYPTPINWRDALLIYRELTPDPALATDVYRLLRASRALSGERDYFDAAQAFADARLIGEAKAVIDEGVQRNMLDVSRVPVPLAARIAARTVTADRAALAGLRARAASGTAAQARTAADNHLGYGQYAEAAELYRLALAKGGEDADLLNSRLGAALALAGRRAEAELALRAVGGTRADLAGFWLSWLARRPAG